MLYVFEQVFNVANLGFRLLDLVNDVPVLAQNLLIVLLNASVHLVLEQFYHFLQLKLLLLNKPCSLGLKFSHESLASGNC